MSSIDSSRSGSECEFLTGVMVVETPQKALLAFYLRVRCLFDWGFWKLCPQVWKELWTSRKTPVHRCSEFVAQGVSETCGYAFYLGVFKNVRFARLWITQWIVGFERGFGGVFL